MTETKTALNTMLRYKPLDCVIIIITVITLLRSARSLEHITQFRGHLKTYLHNLAYPQYLPGESIHILTYKLYSAYRFLVLPYRHAPVRQVSKDFGAIEITLLLLIIHIKIRCFLMR